MMADGAAGWGSVGIFQCQGSRLRALMALKKVTCPDGSRSKNISRQRRAWFFDRIATVDAPGQEDERVDGISYKFLVGVF